MQCQCSINKLMAQGCKCGAFLSGEDDSKIFKWSASAKGETSYKILQVYPAELIYLPIQNAFKSYMEIELTFEVLGHGSVYLNQTGAFLVPAHLVNSVYKESQYSKKMMISRRTLPLHFQDISVQWVPISSNFSIRNVKLTVEGI